MFFSRVHWFNVGKTANKRTKKVLLITNLRNMKQCNKPLNCPKSSNKNQHKQIAYVKMLTSGK